MNPEVQQKIAQKQATNIGNLMYQVTALEAENEVLSDQVRSLKAELEQHKADSADIKTPGE